MVRSYIIIDPGLALPYLHLNYDVQVKCLLYIIDNIIPSLDAPNFFRYEVIPVEYLGGPYPAIGMYTERDYNNWEEANTLAEDMSDKINRIITNIGIDNLHALSKDYTTRWSDIVSEV